MLDDKKKISHIIPDSDKQTSLNKGSKNICQSTRASASENMQIISSVWVDSSRHIWCWVGTARIYPVDNKRVALV